MTTMALPNEDERVLFCEHADVDEDHIRLSGPHHWYFLGENEEVTRQDGECFPVRWLVLCEDCHLECVRTTRKPFAWAAQDAVWIGPPPDITRVI